MKSHNNRSTLSQHRYLSTRKLVTLALFTALTYLVSLVSFPIFPAAPYLKLDFGNVFILLSGFLFGPIEGIIVCLLKEVLSLINSSSGGVGEVANFIMTSSYILVPSLLYRYRKGLKAVLLSLAAACIVGTVVATITNRFIIFPLYMGKAAPAVFESVFWFVIGFNLIKTAAIGFLTFLLYKRLSGILKKLEVT